MKKMIFLLLCFAIGLTTFAQNTAKPPVTRVTRPVAKHDTVGVPIYLTQKADTVKDLYVFYVDSVSGILYRAKGYELIEGLWNQSINNYVSIKSNGVYITTGFGPKHISTDNIFTLIPQHPQSPSIPVKTGPPSPKK